MEAEKPSTPANRIDSATYIPLTIVCAIVLNLGMAFYIFGIQSQKIAHMEERIARQDEYALAIATMKEQIRQQGDTLSEVRSDVKAILSIRGN